MASPVLTSQQQQQVTQLISQVPGVDPTAAADAVATISADGPAVANAISALQKGSPAQVIQAAIPIVAGAVALVNPIAGAVVGGALEVGDQILQALGLFSPPPKVTFSWKFPPTAGDQQGTGFLTAQRPYGPADPHWLSLAVFDAAKSIQVDLVNLGGFDTKTGANWRDPNWRNGYPPAAPQSWLDDTNTGSAMPFGFRVLECAGAELQALGDNGALAQWWKRVHQITNHPLGLPPKSPLTSPGLKAFALVFARAFSHAVEYPLNGMGIGTDGTFVGGYQLAQFVAKAWNAKYPSASHVTFDGNGSSLFDMAIAGWIDQWATQTVAADRNPPIIVNVPTAAQLSAAPKPAPTSSPVARPLPPGTVAQRVAPSNTSALAVIGVGVAVLLGLAFFL